MNDEIEEIGGGYPVARLLIDRERHFHLAAAILRATPEVKAAAGRLILAFDGLLTDHAHQLAPVLETDEDLPSWRVDEAKDVLLWLLTEFLSGFDFSQQDMDYGRTKAYQLTPAHVADWFNLDRGWETVSSIV